MSSIQVKKARGVPAGLAITIAILFVLTAIIGLLGFNVWRILYNPKIVKTTLTQEVLSTEIVPSTLEIFSKWRAEERVKNEESLSGVNEPDIVLLLSFLEAEDWKKIKELLVTDDFVVDLISVSVDGLYRWIDSENTFPDIVWDMSPLKQRMNAQNGIDSIMVAYDRLPDATQEQIDDFTDRLSRVPVGVEVLYNLARFPDPWYEDQVNDYIDSFHNVSENIPSSFELSEIAGDMSMEETATIAKGLLRLVRLLALISWIVALFLLMLIFALKVRSIKLLGQYVGIPLLIVGIIGLSIVFVARPMIINSVLSRLLAAITDFARAEITSSLRHLSDMFFTPLFIQSAVIGGLGLILIIFMIIKRSKTSKPSLNE